MTLGSCFAFRSPYRIKNKSPQLERHGIGQRRAPFNNSFPFTGIGLVPLCLLWLAFVVVSCLLLSLLSVVFAVFVFYRLSFVFAILLSLSLKFCLCLLSLVLSLLALALLNLWLRLSLFFLFSFSCFCPRSWCDLILCLVLVLG